MAAVVTGNSLGLLNSSLYVLGSQGALGQANTGRAGEQVYVNGATGNLIIQNRDELLVGRGPDATLLRTYNGRGLLNDDNGDNWRLSLYRKVYNLTGTVNTAGSTVTRVAEDGAESVYAYDTTLGKYVCHDGAGAYDTLAFDSPSQTWTWSWTDGTTRLTERYDAANGGRLTQVLDQDGNGLSFSYNASGLITQVSDASGETTFLDYSGSNLTQVRTVTSGGQTITRTQYGYDTSNRLTSVTTDLTPDVTNDALTYVVNYTYDGTSKRVASVAQKDGSSLAFTYEPDGAGNYRVKTVTDALGRVSTLNYATGQMDLVDALGQTTSFFYDGNKQLTKTLTPAVNGTRIETDYAYDSNGNVTSVTDGRGNVVAYGYDSNGNRILERDSAGNTVTRVYGTNNALLAETSYLVPDPDGNGAGQPSSPLTTRYVYDANGHLRFVVSAEGRVTEYRYNGFGQKVAAIQYTGTTYNLTGLTPTSTLTEANLTAWLPADKSASLRVDTTYDFRGQVASTTSYASVDAAGNGVADGRQGVTQYVYDQAGNLLKTIDPRGSATADPNDFVTAYAYDGLGRLLSTIDGAGSTTTTLYDDVNRKTVLTSANGLLTTSIYDAAGNLVSVQQSAGATALGTTSYFYDADNRLRRTQDPTVVSTHVLYDEAGRKIGTVDGAGSLKEYRYDGNGNLTKTIEYANPVNTTSLVGTGGAPTDATLASIRPAADAAHDRITWNAYDAANRLVKAVDELGFVTQNSYDGAGRLTDVRKFATAITTSGLPDMPAPSAINPAVDNANDRVMRNFYDGQGKLRGTLDGEGYLVEYKYDAAGQLVETVEYATATNPSLRATGTLAQLIPAASASDTHSYTLYNTRDQVAGTIDGEGYLTEYAYDTAGNKTQVIRYATRVSYSAGATVASSRPAGNAQDQTSIYVYDALNRLSSETNFEGTLTTYTYDSVGNLIQTVKAAGTADSRARSAHYDPLGRVTEELSGNGSTLLTPGLTQAQIDAIWADNAIHYEYDSAGRLKSSTDADGNKTLYYYDADGRLTHTINAEGEVKENRYNALGQKTQTIAYWNRLSSASLPGGLADAALTGAVAAIANPALDAKTTYVYTLRSQVASALDPLNFSTSQTYDAFGEAIASSQQIDASQTLDHSYVYDKRGLLKTTVWDPAGANTSSTTVYDAFGRATQTTDARGNVRTQAYDRLGRTVTTTVDPGAGHLNLGTAISYDAFSRVLTQTDALGNTASYSYNAANRSVAVTTPEGIVSTTLRNRHGETQSVTDGLGNVTTYKYDKDGNLKEVDAPGIDPVFKSYDDAGLLTATKDANGTITAYEYDHAGRVKKRTVDAGAGHLNLATSYAYDGLGRTISVTDPKNVVTQTAFDQKGQVTSVIVDYGAGGLNLTTTYTYDRRGKTLTVIEGSGSSNPRLTRYTYDKLGRLVAQQVDPNGINATTIYAYDKNGNVARKTDANGNVTRYAYDADDRRVYTVDALGGVTKNEYDSNGRVVRTTAYAAPLAASTLAALPAVAALGDINPTATPSTDEILAHVYDRDGREKFTIDALGGVTQKDYDANGNVIRSTAYANSLQGSFTPGVAPQIVGAGPVSGSYVIADPARDRVTRNVYDAANRPVYTIDALNYVKEIQYDGVGQITKTIQYPNPFVLSATPTLAETAAAVSDRVPVTATNVTENVVPPVQPYAYSASAQQDTAGPAIQSVSVTNASQTNSTPPLQPYTYVASANTDTASAATQTVPVTSSGQTNSTPPSQPYTYVASAKSDVASAASQGATLTVQNTSQLQSGIVKNYAWYRSGASLVTGAGVSLDVGSASYVDGTPSQVRADLYLNGALYATTYTDVGSATYEQWIYHPAQYDENNALVSPAYWAQTFVGDETGYAGYHWYGVNNWTGQVNLSTGSLPAGNYTVVVSTRDDYAPTPDYGTGYFDFADGTWATSNTYNVTIGTVVQPTLVSWPTSLQPAGTTASFQYRPAGSTGAYTSVAVSVSGSSHQANLGAIAAGNYEYLISYTDGYGRVLKSASGTLTTTAGQTASAGATFNYTQVTSTGTAGSSISGYIPLAQVPTIDRISATVTDAVTGAVVSSGVLTYPEFEASYNGEVNLKLGSQLANGRYNVAVTVYYKNGTVENKPVFVYEMGPQNVYFVQTLGWASSTALPGTTPTFLYRTAGSTGAFTSAPVTLSGANHQVSLDHIAAGNYEYQIQYKDGYNRILKSTSGTFTVTGSGSSTSDATFNYTQVTSTGTAGSSISGYIPLAQVPTIDRVSATVTDAVTGAVVSSGVLTYPEFEASYNGEVNLKLGSQLANGRYNVAVTVYYKNGTVENKPVFVYEMGPQNGWILQTLSWASSTALPGTTPTFLYRTAGSTGAFTSAPVTLSGANHQVSLDHIAAGNYEYQIQYKDGYNRILKSTSGTFTVTGSGSSAISATFNYTQVTSIAAAGSSMTGYITSAEVPTIDYVEAFVRDLNNNLVSSALTYPEFEPSYAGRVNLKLGSVLADGKYNVTVVLHKKDGTVQTRPVVYYEVGLQPQRTTTVTWGIPGGVAGTSAQFTYAPAGTSSYVGATVVAAGANQKAALINLADGKYSYFVRYYNGTQLVKETAGTFSVAASGSAGAQLQFALAVDDGRQVNSFEYDGAGRLASSTDAEGFTENYGYDKAGNKTSFTNKKGATWTYGYDAARRQTSEISPAVDITTVARDTLAVTSSTAPIETHIGYDALGNVVSRTEAYGRPEVRTTQYQYDALGRQTKTIYPQSAVYNPAADNLGNNGTIGFTEQWVAAETNVAFDALGNAVTNRDAAGNYSYKTYDAAGRVTYEIDAERYVTQYGYDIFGNRTSVTRYATALNFGAVAGLSTHTDGTGFTGAEVAQRLAVTAGASDRTITTTYDQLNRARKVTEPAVYTFDSSAPAGSPQYFTVGRTTKNQYNAYGQLIKQSVLKNPGADGAADTGDDTWEDTYYYYDRRGNKAAQIDALGYLTTWAYDETGDVLEQLEYAKPVSAGWSIAGFTFPTPTSPQAQDPAGYDRRTTYTYDRKNQKLTETRKSVAYGTVSYPLGLGSTTGDLTTTYGYDAVGNVTAVTDPAGATTYTYYDALGRVVASAEPARVTDSGGSGKVVIPPVTVSYSTTDGSPTLSFARTAPADTVVTFEYALAGTQGWTPVALTAQGGNYAAHLTGLPSGHYQYRIQYKLNAGDATGYATGTGELNDIGGSSAASTTIAAVVQHPVAAAIAQTAGLMSVSDGEGGYNVVWNPTNQLNLAWDSLAALGNGNIRVHVTYLTYARVVVSDDGEGGYTYATGLNGVQRSFDVPYTAAQGDTGAQISWDEDIPNGVGYFGVQQVLSVQVFKVVDNQEIDVTDKLASDRLLIRGATSGLSTISVSGTTANPVSAILAATALGDGIYAVDLASLSRGTYSYTSQATGSPVAFEVVNSNPAQGAKRAGVQEINATSPGRSLNVYNLPTSNPPASGDAKNVVMQYRLAGDTGPYLSKTFNAPVGVGDFTIGYDDIADGNYEYIITVTDASNAPVNLTALGGTAAGTFAGSLRIGRGGIPPAVTQGTGKATVIPLTTLRYNAFGNVSQTTRYAKGAVSAQVSGFREGAADPVNDQITLNSYDSHGNLTRTVDPMGNSTFTSYDALGHVRKTWQPITDNDGLVSNAVRVFSYDKVGRQTATLEPSYRPSHALAAAPLPVNWSVSSAADHVTDENGTYWSGTNTVGVYWNDISSWGGNVVVRMYYVTGMGTATYRDLVLASGAAATGTTFSWTETGFPADGGIQYVTAVEVWKQDAQGTSQDNNFGSAIGFHGGQIFLAEQQPGTSVSFWYTPSGQSSWQQLAAGTTGSAFAVDASGLSGSYNYEVLLTRPGESAPSMHLQGTLSVSGGVVTSLAVGNSAASSYTVPGLSAAELTTSQVKYNAFGEITDKGINDGWQQTFEYDNAGHLWRTSQNGTSFAQNKVYLYDLQGKSTAQIESQGLDLNAGYSGPAGVAGLTSGVQRTNTSYDLLERATAQALPSFTVRHDNLEAYAEPLGIASKSLSFDYNLDESGSDSINLSWTDVSPLGNGGVMVEVYYTGSDGSSHYHASSEIASSAAATGTSVSWLDQAYGGTVTEVKISKKDAAGAWVLLFDQGGSGSYNNFITWPASIAGTGVTALLTPAGGAASSVTVRNMGAQYLVNTLGLPANTYTMEVLYQRPGDSAPYAHSTATFSVNGGTGSLTNTTAAVGTSFQAVAPTLSRSLDRWGNAIHVTDANGRTTDYFYNYLNQVVEEDKPTTDMVAENGVTTRDHPKTRTFYDKAGRALGTIDPNGKATTVSYDAAGDVTAEYHPDGGVVSYQYDALGRQVKTIDAVGKPTTTAYDRNNRVVAVTHPIGVETYAYDQAGNRVRSTDANGNTTLYWYDTRGKVIRTRLPGGQETNDYYDARGNRVKEVNANGDQATWSYDYFGRLLASTDIGGGNYTYAYDHAGHRTQQTLSRPGPVWIPNGLLNYVWSSLGSSSTTTYSYYENGEVKSITDSGVSGQTFYEYDAAGNRTRERYVTSGAVVEDNAIGYDELNRVKSINANRYSATYKYDAAGNRREARTVYFDAPDTPASGGNPAVPNNVYAAKVEDDWNLYDSMNRVTLSQGDAPVGGGAVQAGNRSIRLEYDAASRRRTAISSQGTESYNYDDNGRLTSTTGSSGYYSSMRTYDAAGRVTKEVGFTGTGVVTEIRENSYNKNGWLTYQTVRKGTTTTPVVGTGTIAQVFAAATPVVNQNIDYTGYDNVGNVKTYQVSVLDGPVPYTNYYSTDYLKFAGYKESVVHGSSTYFQPGNTTTNYDINGNVTGFSDKFATDRSRIFVTEGNGQILEKTENGKQQYYFFAGDKPVGSAGALDPKVNFDFNYTPVSQQYPAESPGNYLVSKGDTLRSIAMAVYGDAQLWYLIADANGLGSDADLKVGQQLTIPNVISNLHNNSTTFKPVNVGQILGDANPTLPAPPPPSQPGAPCGGFGAIIVAVVVTVIMVVYAYYTGDWGTAAEVSEDAWADVGAGAAADTGEEVVAEDVAADATVSTSSVGSSGVVNAMASNLVTQGINNALGFQHGFNGFSFATSVFSAGITQGLGDTPVGEVVGNNPYAQAIMQNFVAQGLNIVTDQQHGFSWVSVAASVVSAAVTQELSQDIVDDSGVKTPSQGPFAKGSPLTNYVGGLVNGVTRAILSGGAVDWARIATDSFGNALGSSLADQMNGRAGQQQKRLEKETGDVAGLRGLRYTPEQLAAWGPQFKPADVSPVEPQNIPASVYESSDEGDSGRAQATKVARQTSQPAAADSDVTPEDKDRTVTILTPQAVQDLADKVNGVLRTVDERQESISRYGLTMTFTRQDLSTLNQLADVEESPEWAKAVLGGNTGPLRNIFDKYLAPGEPQLIVGPGASYDDVLRAMSRGAQRYGTESGALDEIRTALNSEDRGRLAFNYSGYRNTEVTEFFAFFGTRSYGEYDKLGVWGREMAFTKGQESNNLYIGDGKVAAYPSLDDLPPDLQLIAGMAPVTYGVDLLGSLISGARALLGMESAWSFFGKEAASEGIGYINSQRGVPPILRLFEWAPKKR